ncbi:MAG: GNAT family N-acetyltransferase [Chloroflexota bacterium]
MGGYTRPAVLTRDHDVDHFDCGSPSLTEWLVKYALTAQSAGTSRVFVSLETDAHHVVGYYALAASQVQHEAAAERLRKGAGRYPIPVVLLARLAVDVRHQGRGLGAALLTDALGRVEQAAGAIGVRALLIHAESAQAKAFYLNYSEFEESPTDPFHLTLLIKDLRKARSRAAR